MKKFRAFLCFVMAATLLLTLPVPAFARAPSVVYLSGSGSDANTGLSASKPVATLAHAAGLLAGQGGTIVLCGSLTERTGLTIPAQRAKLRITGNYNGTNYNTTLSFGTQNNEANKNLIFQSEAEIDNLTINYNIISANTSQLLTLYTGPRLTIGSKVRVIKTNQNGTVSTSATQVAIRCGLDGANIASAVLNVTSGTYRYVLAAHTSEVANCEINIGGTAKVYDFVQSGGVGTAMNSSRVRVTGGDVNALYVDAYNRNMPTVDITVEGGRVGTITNQRGGTAFDITSSLSLTVTDSALANIGSIDLTRDFSGAKALIFKGAASPGSPQQQQQTNRTGTDFSDWDTVSLNSGSLVYLTTPYNAPQSGVSISADSTLVLTADSFMPASLSGQPNVRLERPAPGPGLVYVNPQTGRDTNNGTAPGSAVASWNKAISLLQGLGGTIVVCADTIVAPSGTAHTAVPAQSAPLKITGKHGGADYQSAIMLGGMDNNAKIDWSFLSPAEISDITVCFNRPNGGNTSGEIWSGPNLTIGENVSVETTGAGNQITLRTGLYGSAANDASLTVLSGQWNYIQGGNSRRDVVTSRIHFGGTATAKYLQCGGTNRNVGSSIVHVSGGTVLTAMYVNGYGSSGTPANLGRSEITISGGSIADLYDARNAFGESGPLSLTLTGQGITAVAGINLEHQGTITGNKTLVLRQASEAVFNGDFSQWNTVSVGGASTLWLLSAYKAPKTGFDIEGGSTVCLNTLTNSAAPAHGGAGNFAMTDTFYREHADYSEEFYLPLENPKAIDGTDPDKEQGMAVWGDEAFVFQDNGVCKVYNLQTRSPVPVCTFNLASYNAGTPTANFANHCNTVMFSEYFYTDPATGITNDIPLLFVRTGAGTGADSSGYYTRLSIENVTRTEVGGVVSFSTQVLQTVIYNDHDPAGKTVADYNAANGTNYVPVAGWGAPMWLVDSNTDSIYILSAKYRTIWGAVGDTETYPGYNSVSDNYYVITRFDMTDVTAGGTVVLTPADIVDQFTTDLAAFATQGGTLHGSKILYAFGFGQIAALNPNRALVFDLEAKNIYNNVLFSEAMFAYDEIEAFAQYGNKWLVNTQGGYMYALEFDTGSSE